MAKKEPLPKRCPNCGMEDTIIYDPETGEFVCTNCGYVVEEVRFVYPAPARLYWQIVSSIPEPPPKVKRGRRRYVVVARGKEAEEMIKEWKERGIFIPKVLTHFITDPETGKNVRVGRVVVKEVIYGIPKLKKYPYEVTYIYYVNPHQRVIYMPRPVDHPCQICRVRRAKIVVRTPDGERMEVCWRCAGEFAFPIPKVKYKIKPDFPDNLCILCSQYWNGECRFGLPPESEEEAESRRKKRLGYLVLCLKLDC